MSGKFDNLVKSKLKVYEFADGFKFCLAKDIEDYASTQGWRIKVDCEGNRHPGTICNTHIKRIIGKTELRRYFRWNGFDVVSLAVKDTQNFSVISDLVYKEVINYSTVKTGYLDLYNLNAARMIISCMIQDIKFDIPDEDIEIDSCYKNIRINFRAHQWDAKRKNTHTLFDVKCQAVKTSTSMKSFLESNFTEEEKAAIRKYQRLIRETRQNGTRPYVKRNNFKEDENNG